MEKLQIPLSREQWSKADNILGHLSKAYHKASGEYLKLFLASDESRMKYFIVVDIGDEYPDSMEIETPETMKDILNLGLELVQSLTA